MRVDADEFQFLITDWDGELAGGEVDNGLVCYVPGDSDAVAVRTGCHWGWVEVEVDSAERAPAVGAEWEEVVEFGVSCTRGLAVVELGGGPVARLVERGGEYRLRVSARNRGVGRALRYGEMTAPGAAERPTGERYLIEVWPEPVRAAAVVRGAQIGDAWQAAVKATDEVARQRRAAGIAAAVRLRSFIADRLRDGGQAIDGAPAQVDRLYPHPRAELFFYLSRPSIWMACGSASAEPGTDPGFEMYCLDPDQDDDHAILGSLEISGDWTRLQPNDTVEMRWTWQPDPDDDDGSLTSGGWPTQVRIDLADATPAGGVTSTRVRVQHTGFPDHLTDQVEAFWSWQLDRLNDWASN